ncbi:hypothetical protein HID58_022217, partial [Brassica napus]
AKAPHLSSTLPPTLPWKFNKPVHGDRTPKQKVKLNVTEEKLLNLMLKYNGGKPRAETKLKSAVQLQDLLDATRMLVPHQVVRVIVIQKTLNMLRSFAKLKQFLKRLFIWGKSFPHSREPFEMAQGGNFSGIYRKVELKPLKWDGEGEEERPVEALMILKYGGVLTHVGRKHAEELGRFFRYNMYPGEGTGLLRLHSTYHHDLKIYSSDEGRVQMSAAAFAKGMVSLVSKDSSMLDGLDTASIEIKAAKTRLNEIVMSGKKMINELLLFIIIKS